MAEIRAIRFDSPEYADACALRERVLRLPLGMKLRTEDLADDAHRHHFGAWVDGKLVGSISLALARDHARIKQMAVDDTVRRQRVGTHLIAAAEELARQLGHTQIKLSARQEVVKFYESYGYVAVGKTYEEVGIAHRAMEKSLV